MNAKIGHAAVAGFDIENIFHSISDYVSIHDREFRIVRANAALCALLGRTEDELVGRACFTIFHNSGSNWPNCPQLRMQEQMAPITELVEDAHLGVPLLVTCSPVYDENGDLLGAVHIARNVAKEQEREKEAAIAAMQETLAWLKDQGGILTICSSCKYIRNREGEWERIEQFVAGTTGARLSHGMCPSCFRKLFPTDKNPAPTR